MFFEIFTFYISGDSSHLFMFHMCININRTLGNGSAKKAFCGKLIIKAKRVFGPFCVKYIYMWVYIICKCMLCSV